MKKIRLFRVTALVMALVMLACALAGCGSSKSDEELIVGKWKTDIDLGKVMAESMKGVKDSDVLAGLDFTGLTLQFNAEFRADGTYTLAPDQASGQAAVGQMKEKMVAALKDYIRGLYAEGVGISPEEVTDEQMDALLTKLGVGSWEKWGETISQELDADKLFGKAVAEGRYLLKDGKLCTSDSVDKEADEKGDVSLCQVSAKTLKLQAEKAEDVPEFMRELTFSRVG